MKNKTLLLNCSLLVTISLFKAEVLNAQMVGADAYIKGTSVEIGLDGIGGFEGCNIITSPPIAGMHPRSGGTNLFGFVANPHLDSWATYDGDFFTPGTPENGWGFEIGTTGGISGSNNCASAPWGAGTPQDIPGAITSWSYVSPQTSCDWEADYTTGTNLHFKIDYQLQDPDLFYITTISITNNTSSTISDIYYYRNLDPDNNETNASTDGFSTTNTIVSQITSGGINTSVSATQATPWSSLFEFIAIDPNWVAGYGGFTNRDASDMYTGTGFTQTVGATFFADEAIYLAYKIDSLAPSVTRTFKFASVFDPGSVTNAVSALNLTTLSTNDMGSLENGVKVYPNPFADNTTISIGKSVTLSNAEIHIYDVVGKEVKLISNIQSHEFTIDRNNLANGMYFYKLLNKGEAINSGKLIIK